MNNQVVSIGLEGMRGYPVVAEANVRDDKEACVIVGLPDASMKESKERVLSCLHQLDIDVSMKKITIHLSPADQRKAGTGHDCAMLVSVLSEVLDDLQPVEKGTCFLAALSLSGKLMPFHGMIPSIQQALALGYTKIIVPPIDLSFLEQTKTEAFIRLATLQELVHHLRGQEQLDIPTTALTRLTPSEDSPEGTWNEVDFSHIRGQQEAKRALEIAAAGGHHVLLHGPPGCGKSMLSDAFHTIFPDLSTSDVLETYSIYELARERHSSPTRPPYRHPHHSASAVSLIGGGTFPKPGEISLAHRGILFLDELGEFPKKALDMLRQPLETGEVTISRVRQTVHYPARFTLIAATNPCPCGYYGSTERYCTCTTSQIKSYQLKVSGPLYDRIDFSLQLKNAGFETKATSEPSTNIRKRVITARAMQQERYQGNGLNGNVAVSLLSNKSTLTKEQEAQIKEACYKHKWSNRTQVKLIRIARTIADLDEEENITDAALKEALHFKTQSEDNNMQHQGGLHG